MSQRRSTFAGAEDSWGSGQRPQVEMELDITPMIDVTFLLLIFFMVTSTMQAEKDLDVPVARHGVSVETADSTIVEIQNRGGTGAAEPVIVIGENSNATLDDVRAFVKEGIESGQTNVIIRADREISHGFVLEVTKAIDSVEGTRFFYGVQDKPTN